MEIIKKLSENTWLFGSWIENKVNTMHVLELAIGITQQRQLNNNGELTSSEEVNSPSFWS